MDSPTHVREIGSIRPQLRPSLRFVFQEFGGERSCVIEDPLTSKFHRVGLAEYRFLRQLDGTVTFAEAFARASFESGAQALTEREAIAVLSWLVDNRLADLGGQVPDEILHAAQSKGLTAGLKNAFNILSIKIPLGRPDRLLRRVYPFFRPVCGWGFFVVWIGVLLTAAGQVAVHWDKLVRGTEGVLAPHNWLWLLVVWSVLKVWHEFWHGLICTHHGGSVREAGVVLVALTPLGYVDASSSLAFRSKWQRMHVAAAGMYGEAFLASIAALVWANTSPGVANTIALNAMVTASAVTVLFNLNPLMRFDGYYILVDWIEKPNLATRATRLLQSLAGRWLLGLKEGAKPSWTESDTWVCLVYGIAAQVWRLAVFVTLVVAASLLFRGGGLVFATVAVVLWLAPLATAFAGLFGGDQRGERVRPGVALLRCGAAALVLLAIGFFPFRVMLKTSGVVQPAGETVLRAEGPGFVSGLHVRDGGTVEEGALMVRLENRELETRLEAAGVNYRRQDLKRRMVRLKGSTAEYEAEMALLQALRSQYLEQLKYVETLDFVAPRSGRVMASELAEMEGRFVQTGDEILRLADPAAKEIIVPISQDDIDYFRRQLDQPVQVYFEGRGTVGMGRLQRISGRASTEVDYPELTTLGGGPLAVKPRGASGGKGGEHELVQPCFWGAIALPEDAALAIRPGERVRIKFRSDHAQSVGSRVRASLLRYLDHVMARASAAG